jgi:citrate synthase
MAIDFTLSIFTETVDAAAQSSLLNQCVKMIRSKDLVAIERGFNLPQGAAHGLFATERLVGWVADAFERRASGNLIWLRAEFVLE